MRKVILMAAVMMAAITIQAKTLIVYYSYTNNVERIVNELRTQIQADVVKVEPAEKGLDYAADNYAIGSAQIAAIRDNPADASSYPAIDPVKTDISGYDCIIIGAPLWWSQMAAPMQSFLFHHGKDMAGKHIGLIVSSASSGISGVERDARRLIPDGKFMEPSLWIRSSQTSAAKPILADWLKAIDYSHLSAGIKRIGADHERIFTAYSVSGVRLVANEADIANLPGGLYIINGRKTIISK